MSDMLEPDPDFTCPECGCHVPMPIIICGSRPIQVITCADCLYQIPVHLARLSGDITIDEAKRQWNELYRNTQTKPVPYFERQKQQTTSQVSLGPRFQKMVQRVRNYQLSKLVESQRKSTD